MREIKFRAWDNVHKQFDPVVVANLLHQLHDDWEELDEEYGKRFFLSQFTGFFDKNGTEIYEGDIIRPYSNHLAPYKIVFNDGCFCIENKIGIWGTLKRAFELSKEFDHDVEVIGNIYENPELM